MPYGRIVGAGQLTGPLPDGGQLFLHEVGGREEFVHIGLAFDGGNGRLFVVFVRYVVPLLLHGVHAGTEDGLADNGGTLR